MHCDMFRCMCMTSVDEGHEHAYMEVCICASMDAGMVHG